MKLLVTGGSGFLGKRVAAHFAGLGWDVLTPGHKELDITDEAAVLSWFRENRPDAVIHTAAVSDTGACQRDPEWSETINVAGTVHMAKGCRQVGAKLAICSSDQVYFRSRIPGPHKESEALEPGNVYGGQKLRAEQLALEIWPETVCLRLAWMYARDVLPGDRGHFLATIKEALEDETKTMTWPVHDIRGITDTKWVVQNLPAALALPGGVWNFGSENHGSTYALVKSVLEQLGQESALRRLTPNEEAFADIPRDISMDPGKLNAAGIFFPTTEDGLRMALQADALT